MDLPHKKKEKKIPAYYNEEAKEKQRREKMDFEEELKRESKEKQEMLQDIIREAAESGCKLPPSLIRMLHGNNGKLTLLQCYFVKML